MSAASGGLRDERGQGAFEYAIIIAFIAMLIVGGLKHLGTSVNTTLSTASRTMVVSSGGGSQQHSRTAGSGYIAGETPCTKLQTTTRKDPWSSVFGNDKSGGDDATQGGEQSEHCKD